MWNFEEKEFMNPQNKYRMKLMQHQWEKDTKKVRMDALTHCGYGGAGGAGSVLPFHAARLCILGLSLLFSGRTDPGASFFAGVGLADHSGADLSRLPVFLHR